MKENGIILVHLVFFACINANIHFGIHTSVYLIGILLFYPHFLYYIYFTIGTQNSFT